MTFYPLMIILLSVTVLNDLLFNDNNLITHHYPSIPFVQQSIKSNASYLISGSTYFSQLQSNSALTDPVHNKTSSIYVRISHSECIEL